MDVMECRIILQILDRGVLDHVDDDELPGRVESFIGENRIPVTYEVLLKGARMIKHEDLARSGRSLSEKQRSIPGLTQADLDLLKTEGHWRHQPLTLYMTVALASVAAIVQGWDQTGTNGANLQWPKEFISGYKATDLTGQNALIVGLVNAAPYIVIAVLACWISDPLNHWLGRRKTIWIGALLSLIAPIASAFTRRWPQLLGCRFLLGAGMGLKEVTVPILSAEIAPPEIRGALVMSWQICTAAGIFLGSIANLVAIEFVPDHPDQRHSNIWRYQLGSAFIPAVPLLFGIFYCPESPRWLIRKNRPREAYFSLLRLRGQRRELLAARDLYYIHEELSSNPEGGSTIEDTFGRFKELFVGKKRVRRATVAASTAMIAQQLCGINILAFYSSTLFSNLLHPEAADENDPDLRTPLYLTLGFGAANFLFAWPAFFIIDRFGRRVLLLSTFPLMFIFLLTAGLCVEIKDASIKTKVVTTMIILFAASYSPGVGPIAFTYSAEVFPMSHREIGMSWAVAMNNLFAAALSLSFPSINQKFSHHGAGAMEFFAGLNLLSWILVFLFVPETCLRTLENISLVFAIETTKHMQHQIFKVTPWFWKKVTFRDPGPCPLFYQKDIVQSMELRPVEQLL
ncbi:hypothetical protein M438DRAFT_151375 [Aureobasidium pullulans EXF-150]|uniref:Major facilitator superfamily (MFS) profile domain-containing protein n=1 Tax=Aureobasidium pullulans EXF-150 TaxID=1043002 RepID=A0A074XXE4_AURPU|nr:uncharacterized protein M438DRAFT_151375 [Aureobasidium pullulans EXF-150]KEQ79356.1 hypothetical protein M438DRAFT_151375 [Aureobasidium pullulans EXF-150]